MTAVGKGTVVPELAGILLRIRSGRKWTSRELARNLRMPVTTVWRAERGNAMCRPTIVAILRRAMRWQFDLDLQMLIRDVFEKVRG